MTRIAIVDRADMNADQARVYDAAKQSGGPVGGPYYAYIRLPKLFEAAQGMRGLPRLGAAVAPRAADRQPRHRPALGRALSVVRAGARARSPPASIRPAIDAINARKTPKLTDARERMCYTVASELLANKRLSNETYAAAEAALGLETSSRWSRPPAASPPPA